MFIALSDLFGKIIDRLRTEPVATRAAITAILVALNTQVLDLFEAIGVESSDLPDWADWFVENPTTVESAVGVIITLVIWLGAFGARKRVTPLTKVADQGGEVWGEHLGD